MRVAYSVSNVPPASQGAFTPSLTRNGIFSTGGLMHRVGSPGGVAIEVEKLDAIERKYLEIARKHHVFVSQGGKVVYDGDVKLEDDGPAMQAMSGLLKVAERRAKLLGLDAPVKAQVEVVNYDADSIEYRVLELRRALESTGGEPIPLDGRTSETRAVTA